MLIEDKLVEEWFITEHIYNWQIVLIEAKQDLKKNNHVRIQLIYFYFLLVCFCFKQFTCLLYIAFVNNKQKY